MTPDAQLPGHWTELPRRRRQNLGLATENPPVSWFAAPGVSMSGYSPLSGMRQARRTHDAHCARQRMAPAFRSTQGWLCSTPDQQGSTHQAIRPLLESIQNAWRFTEAGSPPSRAGRASAPRAGCVLETCSAPPISGSFQSNASALAARCWPRDQAGSLEMMPLSAGVAPDGWHGSAEALLRQEQREIAHWAKWSRREGDSSPWHFPGRTGRPPGSAMASNTRGA